MPGVFRTGYQAVANAVWSLVAIAARTVNVTHFGGSAGTFASGRPEVNTSHFGGTAGTFAAGRPEVNSTHFGGSAGTFSSGKPHAVGTLAGIHGSVSFGSTETSHDSSLAGLSAAAIGEIELIFTGPYSDIDSGILSGGSREWAVSCEVVNVSGSFYARFYKTPLGDGANAGDLLPSTHYFNARRKVLP